MKSLLPILSSATFWTIVGALAAVAALFPFLRDWIRKVVLRHESLLPFRTFYGDELYRHQHDYVERAETIARGNSNSSAIRPIVEEIKEWADGSLTFLILSGEVGIGKSRCCIEVAKGRRDLKWINVKGFKDSPDQLMKGLDEAVRKGAICVYEDYQENSSLFRKVTDVIIRKEARLLVTSWEQEGPERAISGRASVKKIHLQKMAEDSLTEIAKKIATGKRQNHLSQATLGVVVRISEGIPAITVLATDHYMKKKTLDGITGLDDLMNSVYWTLQSNFREKWNEIEPLLGKMCLGRGIATKSLGSYYKLIASGLGGQVVAVDSQLIVQPIFLSDHIAKKTYFDQPGLNPAFEIAIDELLPGKANEILITLSGCAQREAAALLLQRCKTLPPKQVLSMGLSAYAAFRDLGFIVANLGQFWNRVWELSEPDEYDRTAMWLSLLGMWPDAERCWNRTLELYSSARDHLGVALTLSKMAAMYQRRGNWHQANDFCKRALKAFEFVSDGSGVFGMAQTLTNMGLAYAAIADWDEAVEHFNKALQVFDQLEGDVGELGVAQTKLSIGAVFQFTGDLRRALEFYQPARVTFERLKYVTGMADAYRRMSLLYADKGDWGTANELYERTCNLPGFVGDLNGIAQTYLDFGSLYLKKSDWANSEDLYQRALDTYGQLGDLRGIGKAQIGLADVNYEKSDWPTAFRHYEAALAAFEQVEERQGIASARLGLGLICQSRAQWTEASNSYAVALEIFEKLGDKQGEARTELSLASLYQSQSQFDAAIALLENAKLKFNGNRLGVAQACINLGSAYHSKGKHVDAIRSLGEGLSIAKKTENVRQIYGAYIALGRLYQSLGKMDDALGLYDAAFRVFQELGDLSGVANTLLLIGSVHTARGEWDKGRDFTQKALSIFKQIQNKHGMAAATSALGTFHYKRSQYDQALEFYGDAIDLYQKSGNQLGMANQYRSVGWIYYRQGESQKAIEFQSRSLAITEEIGDIAGTAGACTHLGTIHSYIGAIHSDREQFKKAIEHFEKGLRLEEELRSPSGIALACNNLGMAYELQGSLDQAEALFERALGLTREIGDRQLESYVLTNFGTIYADRRQYEKARAFYKDGLAIKQELGDLYGIAYSDAEIGKMYLKMEKWEDAEPLLLRSAATLSDIGSKVDVDRVLPYTGCLAAHYRDCHDEEHALKIEAAVATIHSKSLSIKGAA